MPTITADIAGTSTTPDLVFPWATEQASGNIFHDISGAATPWISLQGAHARTGELHCFYVSETNANTARTLFSTADTFTLTYAERPSIEMTFAVDGSVTMELDADTSEHWVVRFGYREVA